MPKKKKKYTKKWLANYLKKKYPIEMMQSTPSQLVLDLYSGKITYEEYLESEWWKSVRDKARTVYTSCAVCGEDSIRLHMHHRNYKNIGREKIEDLIGLCPICHKSVHKKIKELQSTQYEKFILWIALMYFE